jgi:hypothetical protein
MSIVRMQSVVSTIGPIRRIGPIPLTTNKLTEAQSSKR